MKHHRLARWSLVAILLGLGATPALVAQAPSAASMDDTPASRDLDDAVERLPGQPRLAFDVLSAAYRAIGPGLELSAVRLRWRRFQLQVASAGIGFGLTPAFMHYWVGMLGVGARFPYGPERHRDVGFLVFPLSIGVHGQGPFSASCTTDGEADCPTTGPWGYDFARVRLYWRRDFDSGAVELGLDVPLLWTLDDTNHKTRFYRGLPPIGLTIGVVAGRMR